VVNYQAFLPFVDSKIPGWTMEGKPSGTNLKQGKVILSEARVSFRAGELFRKSRKRQPVSLQLPAGLPEAFRPGRHPAVNLKFAWLAAEPQGLSPGRAPAR
jgi:hypothetical protein